MATMKETTIQLRVGEDEKAVLKALAEKNGLTLSEFIRSLCKKAVLATMNGDSLITARLQDVDETASTGGVDLTKRNIPQVGGKDWAHYTYTMTPEKKTQVENAAKRHGTTANTMIRNLLMKWLVDKQNGVEESLTFVVRPRGVVSSERITVSLERSAREKILGYLKESGLKMTVLIDALIDKYAVGESTQCKE